MAEREDLDRVDVLDVIDQALQVAVEAEDVAMGVLGSLVLVLDGRAQLGQARVDQRLALAHLVMDVEALGQVLLLGDLEAHDLMVGIGRPIKREAGRIGAPMPQRLKH